MNKEKIADYISYLKSNPESYVEIVTGKRLPIWQRLIIEVIDKMTKKNINHIKFKNGSIVYCSSKKNGIRSARSKLVGFYCYGCKEVHENYEINNVQFIGEYYQMCKESYDELLESYVNDR